MHLRVIISFFLILYSEIVLSQWTKDEYLEKQVFSIYFESDKYDVTSKHKSIIRKEILNVGSFNLREVFIEGHTDSDASNNYNQTLSFNRALAVSEFLVSQGVKENRIRLESFGEEKPKSESKKENRRVDITLIYSLPPIENNEQGWIIKGYTFDFKTKQRIPSVYSIEIEGRLVQRKTDSKGNFILKIPKPNDISLIFTQENYLNTSRTISKNGNAFRQTDTIFLPVPLQAVEVTEKIKYDHVYFYTNKAILKPESKEDLNNILNMMKADDTSYFEIQGHMNYPANEKPSLGQVYYNYRLSHERAKEVYDFLIKNGIPRKRLTYKGYSNSRPVYPIPTTALQADQNKRVEVWKLKIIQ